GSIDSAERASLAAITGAVDAAARADFWRRWEASLAVLADDLAVPRLLRSADYALGAGDVDRALAFARAAVARGGGETYAALLTLGRATTARGDLAMASVALGKAMDRAPDA